MSVIYMRELELNPASYESRFTRLTGGVNKDVRAWILGFLTQSSSIIEVGPGPGVLASAMARAGHRVTAIEKNQAMIDAARGRNTGVLAPAPGPGMLDMSKATLVSLAPRGPVPVAWVHGSATSLRVPRDSQDHVVTTFAMSELRPLEQQLFLQEAWRALKPGGTLLVAEEFEPRGRWARMVFTLRRRWFTRKAGIKEPGMPHPMTWFERYLAPTGFAVIETREWQGGAIKILACKKEPRPGDEPGHHEPRPFPCKGWRARLRVARTLLGGQVDRDPVEPGVYRSGTPGPGSPVIVTANYAYTAISVMRDLAGTDAWMLCVDSRGINVWCAARGGELGNEQLLEAVRATGIGNLASRGDMILPQLAAGGIAAPRLPARGPDFPFTVSWGPAWSKHLPAYLRDRRAPKPDAMKLARFTTRQRATVGLTHACFLLRKVFRWPLVTIFLAALVLGMTSTPCHGWVTFTAISVLASLLVSNAVISLALPVTRFTRRFMVKGVVFGALNAIIMTATTWSWLTLAGAGSLPVLLATLAPAALHAWTGFFCTMSFSGYTMDTSPAGIAAEYPAFSRVNKTLLVVAIGLIVTGGLLACLLPW